MDVCLV